MMEIVIFILIAAGMFALAIWAAVQAQKRIEALRGLAARLGLQFTEARDYAMPAQYRFLDALDSGHNRYAYNVLCGTIQGHRLTAFDYHYETYSTDSKGRRHTHHHQMACLTLKLPAVMPELRIAPEGILSKFAQALGFDDIDFESHEFSRTFCVRSRDRKFAYDVCNARMIEHLLENKDISLEIERDVLAFCFMGEMDEKTLERDIDRLVRVRSLMPDYLWTSVEKG